MPVPVAARSEAWVVNSSPVEIVGSNPTGDMDVFCESCVLLGRELCNGLITRPEESYRLWRVVVCDLETSWMRRPWPTGEGGGAVAPPPQKNQKPTLMFFKEINSPFAVYIFLGYWIFT